MDIYLSASAIKDFLSCSKRYEFRRFYKRESEETEAMLIGTAVHDTLEKCWNVLEKELRLFAEELSFDRGFSEAMEEKYFDLLGNYQQMKGTFTLSERDSVEEFFTIPYSDGVFITGKFDRILEDSVILDWKTGNVPVSLTYDPQFVLYDWAFEKIYGYKPSTVMAVSLAKQKVVSYKRNRFAVAHFMEEIVPSILARISAGDYNYEGRYSFISTCKNCSFLRYCNDELARRNPIERAI